MIWETILIFFFISLPFQLGRHFWPESASLFGLRIDYLSPTLYLQDIFIILLISGWLIKNFKKALSRKVIVFTACYLLFAVLNILSSFSTASSFFAWLRISEFCLLGIVLAQNSKKVWRHLIVSIPFFVLLETALGVWQIIKQSSIGGIFWFLGERTFNIFTPGISRGSWLGKVFLRPYGTFSHPNSLSGFIFVCLILLLMKKKLTLFDKAAVIAGMVLIILAFSRTVWFSVLIVTFGVVLINLIKGYLKKPLILNFTYFVSLFLVLVSVFLFSRTMIDSSSFDIRVRLASFALSFIKSFPFLGIGANNFIIGLSQKTLIWEGAYLFQPVHNIFLLTASETGLIGLLIFALFLCLTFYKLLSRHDYYLVVPLFVILFTGLSDHYWLTLIQNQLLLVIVLALSWGRSYNNL